MPVRLRITILFSLAVFVILGIVCVCVYYFSAASRLDTIQKRLTNRAITTSRLLRQSDVFDPVLVHRIDSLTSMAFKRKSIEVFDRFNKRIYHYSDHPDDAISVQAGILSGAREKSTLYFSVEQKDVIAYSDVNDPDRTVIIAGAEDEDGKARLLALRAILLASFAIGVVASFLGGLFFSGRLLQPVRRITADVNDISVYNLERRIATRKNKDEWNQLSVTLNNLFDRLKSSFDMQRRFIANASHELSTPLTLIGAQLEVTLQRNRSETEYRQAMEIMLKDVRHMNNLVQTLLQFATTAGNAGGLNIEPVRMDEILMQLPSALQKMDNRYKVSLQFDAPPEQEEDLLVLGNEALLFAAIKNVAVNACKYSPDHHASVAFSTSHTGCLIKVTDKGIGIDENALQHIFQPFYRVQESRTEKGFGLGLSLTSQIVKLHKGTITVQSAPGRGSTFTIALPNGQVS
jgi:two-component system, OmpR family, sensor histidine kinase ArlS